MVGKSASDVLLRRRIAWVKKECVIRHADIFKMVWISAAMPLFYHFQDPKLLNAFLYTFNFGEVRMFSQNEVIFKILRKRDKLDKRIN